MNRLIIAAWLSFAAVLTACGSPETVEELRAAGETAMERREYAEARGYFRRAITIETKNRDLLFLVAEACRLDYKYDSALYFLKRADLMHPGDIEINRQIHEIAIGLGDWQNAIDAIETMARAGDTVDQYHAQLADLWFRNGQGGRAYHHARRALLSRPDNQAIYLQTATWAARYDSLEVALEILDEAISKFGPQNQFVVNKAMLLSYAGQNRRAEGILRPLIEQRDPPDPTLQLNLANILAAQPERHKKEEALRIYEQIRDILAGAYPVDSLMQHVRTQLE